MRRACELACPPILSATWGETNPLSGNKSHTNTSPVRLTAVTFIFIHWIYLYFFLFVCVRLCECMCVSVFALIHVMRRTIRKLCRKWSEWHDNDGETGRMWKYLYNSLHSLTHTDAEWEIIKWLKKPKANDSDYESRNWARFFSFSVCVSVNINEKWCRVVWCMTSLFFGITTIATHRHDDWIGEARRGEK